MQPAVPAPGTSLWIRQRRWRVERVRRTPSAVVLEVTGHEGRCTFLAPFDRPSTTAVNDRWKRVRTQHVCARLAGLLARSGGDRMVWSALDARIDILPHQLEPALAVLAGARRVLVADEVGLGKTIQAGLIADELRRRLPAFRALLLVPASLRAQWLAELRDRFNVAALATDASGIAQVYRSGGRGDNPWLGPGVWIASIDYLKQPHVLDTLPLRAWDLVIVDEAHHACGDSDRHRAANALARRSRHVVLLTATPHSGDAAAFNRLVGLGRLPALRDDLTIFRRTRQDVARPSTRRVRWQRVPLSPDETRLLDALIGFERAVLSAAGSRRRGAALLLLCVLRKRALSTTASLRASLDRRLAWLEANRQTIPDWRQQALMFEGDADVVTEEERASLEADVGLDLQDERSWLGRLGALADAAAGSESKVSRLVALIGRSREPVVIFTEFRDSLAVLAEQLRSMRPISAIHGGLGADEQQREIAAFLTGRSSVLLATDVAGQGLNLQTRARWVINLELPWNPARLEQRAGRVDRIGQTRSVHVTMLLARHAAEADVVGNIARRTLSAQRALGSDVLRTTLPSERHLLECVFSGAPLPAPVPAHEPPVTRRWARPARCTARDVLRRRALAARWWGDADAANRVAVAPLLRLPRLRKLTPGGLLVFRVPINSRSGLLLERHVVAVRVSAATIAADLAGAIERARTAAARAQAARVRRLGFREERSATTRRVREQAIAEELATTVTRVGLQGGLFDKRLERASEDRGRRRDVINHELAQQLRDLEDRAHVTVGPASLELVFMDRKK